MRGAEGCQLFGIQQALGGIEDAVILFHTVVGCHFGTLAFQMSGDMRKIRQCSTIISDKEVVFGGEDSIRKAIDKINKEYDYNLLIIISGCVSEIIGDDIQAVIKEVKEKSVIYVNGAGFLGGYDKGFENGLKALINLMKEPTFKKEKSINIIGIEKDGYLREGDIQAIKELIGDNYNVNFIGSSCTLENIIYASEASLNIVVDRGKDLCEEMKNRFNIPFEVINYPYGVLGAINLLNVLENNFNVNFENKKIAMKEEIKDGIEKIYGYLQSVYGTPVAIIGSYNRAYGMKNFLEQELGFEVLELGIKEELVNLDNFYEKTRNTDVSMIFGSSFEKDFAFLNSLVYIPYDYPVFDRIDITNKTYIGSKGTLNLVENILNQIHISKQKRGATYQ